MKREEQPYRDDKSISQYLLGSEVMGQHREQTAITDTKTDGTWHQHLWERAGSATVTLVQGLPPDKLPDMVLFPQLHS